mmetsp:Transcript_19445/g.57839  ORF Transcript_19445/g.57839 Transcript_19445/m.57839 type:complete len:224 (+) Transcript_19445:704-1375(+)
MPATTSSRDVAETSMPNCTSATLPDGSSVTGWAEGWPDGWLVGAGTSSSSFSYPKSTLRPAAWRANSPAVASARSRSFSGEWPAACAPRMSSMYSATAALFLRPSVLVAGATCWTSVSSRSWKRPTTPSSPVPDLRAVLSASMWRAGSAASVRSSHSSSWMTPSHADGSAAIAARAWNAPTRLKDCVMASSPGWMADLGTVTSVRRRRGAGSATSAASTSMSC